MKTIRISLVAMALLGLALTGCSPDDPTHPIPEIARPDGPAALARYVAIGNSLTAGFMDGGLSIVGQLSSYPAQIAGQLGESPAPGSDPWFSQPLIALPGVGSSTPSTPANAAGVLHWNGASISVLDETPLIDLQANLLLASLYPTPYRNLGVPGATTLDVTAALNSSTSQSPGNRYFDLILRNPTFGDVNMLDQAIAQGPTLVSVWIGNNDVLGGATGGQPELGVNVTPPAEFETMLDGIITTLVTGVEDRFLVTPHLVVGNIPSITSVPYFMPKALFDQITTGGLGSYPTDEDDVAYVRFPALAIADGSPLDATWTLTADEVQVVEAAVAGYNAAIAALADEHGFTVADLHALLGGLDAASRTHFQVLVGGGMTVSAAAAATAFSLDGIHPNSRGYSLVANAFIEAINTELGLSGADAVSYVDEAAWDPTYASYAGKSPQLAGLLR
ncbi:MAG: GDSL-type esterase/lipase family protein [Candidatus Krumholzibacteriia bacterium]